LKGIWGLPQTPGHGGVQLSILQQLGIDPKLILVNILGFVLLLWILKKFLYGPITKMLADRAEQVRSTYEAAEAEKASMEQLRTDYERRLAGIEAEARQKIQTAIKEAQSVRDEIIADSRGRAEGILQRGQEELLREREKTLVALRQEVADLVIGASSRLIERSLDDAAHRKLVDDFISSVGKTK
jgi:F-type H+-transporting ATPase subunit b